MMVDQVQFPCTLKDLEALVEQGYIREFERKGTVIIRQGEPVYLLGLILHGNLEGFSDDQADESESPNQQEIKNSIVLPTISENEFIGSLEFMDHKRDLDQFSRNSLVSLKSDESISSSGLPTPVYDVKNSLAQLSIRTKDVPCEILVWNFEDLEVLFRDSPGTRRVLNTLIAYDVTQKFQSLRTFSQTQLSSLRLAPPTLKSKTMKSKKKFSNEELKEMNDNSNNNDFISEKKENGKHENI